MYQNSQQYPLGLGAPQLPFASGSDLVPSAPTSTAVGRKQACRLCRHRKKKCDGKQPACSPCTRWNITCVYEGQGLDPKPTQIQNSKRDRGAAPMPVIPLSAPSDMNAALPVAVEDQRDPWSWDFGMSTTFGSQPFDRQTYFLSTEALAEPVSPTPSYPNFSSMSQGQFQPMSTPKTSLTELSTSRLSSVPNSGGIFPNIISPSTSPGASFPDTVDFSISAVGTPISNVHGDSRDDSAPSIHQYLELAQLFFAKFHPLLPCLHQIAFLEQIGQDGFLTGPSALTWAVIAVASKAHPDPKLQARSSTWLSKAMHLFDASIKSLSYPTETLQAAVWIIFQSYVMADMAEMWVFLGKACRLTSLLGWNRIDSARPGSSPFGALPKSSQEKEERRKTIWALYYLDRSMSCLCGWAVAIDDRQFMVKFPIDDEVFQASTPQNLEQIPSESFTRNLTRLIAPALSADITSKSPMQLIYKVSVLLGCIIDHHNNLHPSSREQQEAEFANLENILARFCLAAPQPLNSTLHIHSQPVDRVIWLHFLLHTCTILLYHPTVATPESSNSAGNEAAGGESPGFRRCLSSMRNTLHTIKEASNVSISSLLNPFLVPTYFLCARFLIIDWLEKKDQALRSDIDLVLMLFDRLGERWGPLATKYRTSVLHDLGKDVQAARRMLVGTGSYLGEECAT